MKFKLPNIKNKLSSLRKKEALPMSKGENKFKVNFDFELKKFPKIDRQALNPTNLIEKIRNNFSIINKDNVSKQINNFKSKPTSVKVTVTLSSFLIILLALLFGRYRTIGIDGSKARVLGLKNNRTAGTGEVLQAEARRTAKDLQLNIDIPTIISEDLEVQNIDVAELARLLGGVNTEGADIIMEGGSLSVGEISDLAGIDTVTKATLERILELDGELLGTLDAVEIQPGAITADKLEDTGVSAGDYGSTSEIPVLTIDEKGRVISVDTTTLTSEGIASGTLLVDNLDISNEYIENYVLSYDEDTGKFIWVAGGGAGGSENLSGLTDTEIESLTNSSVLIYDSSEGKWLNKNISGDIAMSQDGVTTIQDNAVTLGTQTTGDYVSSITVGDGLLGSASGEGSLANINLDLDTTGTTSTRSSNSGLESTSEGARILGGCTDAELLKWNALTQAWECQQDSGENVSSLAYDATLNTPVTMIEDDTNLAGGKDIFVYDTNTDIDYGRWVDSEEAQSSSWYNETLDNSGTNCEISSNDRCGDKAFPYRAILVITDDRLYIYDGQDNTLWMKFTVGNGYAFNGASVELTSVYALNGVIYVGTTTNGLIAIDFIGDRIYQYDYNGGSGGRAKFVGEIKDRNSNKGYGTRNAWGQIASDRVEGIHARIVSGKLYVAASTLGGVSVINVSDRNVVRYIDN